MDVAYEGIILENADFLRHFKQGVRSIKNDEVSVPEGVANGVSPEVYGEYRKGRDSACVDIVIVTNLEDGKPAVLLSKRAENVCYGGKWWIYGGALQSYRSIEDFISERAEKECGVPVKPRALIGVYRTMSSDFIGSTLQPCYVAVVPIADIRAHKKVDDAHSNVRLFTLQDLEQIPPEERHWYPIHVAMLSFLGMHSI